ncbi:hypothetical protein EMCG_06993 [[Emmonsia] crescens]|uniref:Uncharacterized protein n=1 Tax=[Emmonsia] crescens TaxID=73230 RepID=A0A0G2IAL0_9EURO|nr:hypothetical protein EMCG_06993 [Emmonsia crescens UAMH 3008]
MRRYGRGCERRLRKRYDPLRKWRARELHSNRQTYDTPCGRLRVTSSMRSPHRMTSWTLWRSPVKS